MQHKEFEVFYWSDVRTLSRSLDKRMLLKDGVTLSIKCNLKNESPRMTPSQNRLVKFDRNFVAFRLAQILEPIANAPDGMLANIMQEALFILANKQDGIELDPPNQQWTKEEEQEEDDGYEKSFVPY